MALARRAIEDAAGKRRTVSAVTIQAAARRRAAIARYGPNLTLGAARRKREARAAAEAARPRRRWNRGGPSAAGPGGAATVAPAVVAATGVGGKGNGSTPETRDVKSHRLAESKNRGSISGVEDRNAGGGGGHGVKRGTTTTAESPQRKAGGHHTRPVASSSKKELDQQQQRNLKEPAQAWEHGRSHSKATAKTSGGAKSSGGGGGSGVNFMVPTTDNTNMNSSNNADKPGGISGSSGEESSIITEGSVGDDEGRHDKGLNLSVVETRRASQEASERFVRDSIQAAVLKAGEIPGWNTSETPPSRLSPPLLPPTELHH